MWWAEARSAVADKGTTCTRLGRCTSSYTGDWEGRRWAAVWRQGVAVWSVALEYIGVVGAEFVALC